MGKLNTVQNGKGSKDRVSSLARFEAGYDNIDWGHGDNRTFKDAKKRFAGGGTTVASGEDIKPMIYGDSVFSKEALGKLYQGLDNYYKDVSAQPPSFANMVVDDHGKLIPAPWSVCNLPPGEFNKPYTIITCDSNGKVETREVNNSSSIGS